MGLCRISAHLGTCRSAVVAENLRPQEGQGTRGSVDMAAVSGGREARNAGEEMSLCVCLFWLGGGAMWVFEGCLC